jgi:GNAT superfamily N-acetyltransferase
MPTTHGPRCYWDVDRCGWVCPPPPVVEIDDDPARLDVDVVHRMLAASYWAAGIPRSVVEASIAGSECWGAYVGTATVGFARLVTDRTTFGWLGDVFVVPGYRRCGIGTALVEAAVARAAGYGLRRVMLATRDAHALYRRHGFVDSAPGMLMERCVASTVPYPG